MIKATGEIKPDKERTVRFYRDQIKTEGLFSFKLSISESDLFIVSDRDCFGKARNALKEAREQLESYILQHPLFVRSFTPVRIKSDAPEIVKKMNEAAKVWGVGPMAAVAGAVARYVGEAVKKECSHLVIENGGDIYVRSKKPVILSVYAGETSPFTGKLRFEVDPAGKSLGICTSSGSVGHSISFGNADAVVAVSESPEMADAAATAIANRIRSADDVERVMNREVQNNILKALIIVIDDKMAAWGDLRII